MLCINNNFSSKQCSFKQKEKIFAVKIGKKSVKSDEYINMIDRDIIKNAFDRNSYNLIFNTYNFGRAQLAIKEYEADKIKYKKIIDRCFQDLDNAIAKNEPKEAIKKLTDIIEVFIRKYGHLG